LELGLIDQLGRLPDAVACAAEKAGLEEYDIRVIPRPKNFLEMMIADMSDESDEAGTLSTGQALSAHWRTAALWRVIEPQLARMQPQRAAAIRRAWTQIEVLQREQLNLLTPELMLGR
jgi:protease-4